MRLPRHERALDRPAARGFGSLITTDRPVLELRQGAAAQPRGADQKPLPSKNSEAGSVLGVDSMELRASTELFDSFDRGLSAVIEDVARGARR
jgi:hypothetical protein